MRVAFVSALLLMLATATARAEGGDSAKAESLFRQGREAAEARNYAVACPKFEESYRLEPAPGTLLNLADCEENRGQLVRAWQHFRKLHDELPPSDERKSIADARARAVEQRAPKLRVVLASSSPATVVRDDVVLGHGSLGARVPVEAGRHVIVVSATGRHDNRYEVSVGDGEDKEIAVSVGDPESDTKPPVVAHRDAVRDPPNDGSARRTTAFVLGGVGLASVGTGAVFGIVALTQLSSANAACTGNVCPNQDALSQYNRAQAFAIAADVAIGVGIALVGTAVVVALTGTHAHGQAKAYAWGQF